jgi:hypothetical protein
MKRWMHKIEVIVDKAIGPCLILLLAVIIIEIGFSGMTEEYNLQLPIEIADYAIIAIFALDLVFKYMRVRHIPEFLRRYWLDIIAVFPFFLLFRFYELAAGVLSPALSEGAQTAQQLLHEGSGVEKEGSKILSEMEKIAKETTKVSKLERSTRFVRFIRPLFRVPRFLKSVPKINDFYEKPSGEHHRNEFMKK